MCKVSIVVPVYNGEKYINECIDSILKQSLQDIEIICVDDGSKDHTSQILDEYSKQDSRVKVIHKPNTGYGHSMNVGFDMATGMYIGVVESDDYVDAHMFEDLYYYAQKDNLDVVKADFRIFLGDADNRNFIYRPLFDEKRSGLYNKIINYKTTFDIFDANMVTWAGIYKRDFIKNNNIRHNESPGASYQDNGFWIQVMMYAERVSFIDKPYYYLRRDNENSSVYSKDKVFAMCDEYDFMRACVIKRGVDIDVLLPFLWKRRFNAYNVELYRIAYAHRKSFLERFRKDFNKAIESREIDSGLFSNQEWDKLIEIVDNPKATYHNNWKIGNITIERLRAAKYIAVYGAKANARRALCDVKALELDHKVLGMVVSKIDDNIRIYRGVIIQELETIEYPKDTLFIIGSQEKYFEEIRQTLLEKGYTNVMTCLEMKK